MKDTHILVRDSNLECQFFIYSAMTGELIKKHEPDAQLGLGVRSLVESPNKKLLACGLFTTTLFVYNNQT